MKKILIFFSVFLFADVSDIIVKIKEIEGLKKHFLNIEYNIFGGNENKIIFLSGVPKEDNINFKIYAIFNDKVNINGKWYKKGDEINGYKIIKITDKNVFLKKENKIIKLNIANIFLKVKK